jgi:hypothetical protein
MTYFKMAILMFLVSQALVIISAFMRKSIYSSVIFECGVFLVFLSFVLTGLSILIKLLDFLP